MHVHACSTSITCTQLYMTLLTACSMRTQQRHMQSISDRVMSLCAGGLAMCPSSEYSGLWSAKTSQFVQHFRQHRMYEGHDVDCTCSDRRFIDFYTGVPGFRINYIIL